MPRRKTTRRKHGGYAPFLDQPWQNIVSARQRQLEQSIAELRYMQPDDPARVVAALRLQRVLNSFWVGIDRGSHMEDPLVLRAFEVTDSAQELIDNILEDRISGSGKKKRRATRRRRVVRKV